MLPRMEKAPRDRQSLQAGAFLSLNGYPVPSLKSAPASMGVGHATPNLVPTLASYQTVLRYAPAVMDLASLPLQTRYDILMVPRESRDTRKSSEPL